MAGGSHSVKKLKLGGRLEYPDATCTCGHNRTSKGSRDVPAQTDLVCNKRSRTTPFRWFHCHRHAGHPEKDQRANTLRMIEVHELPVTAFTERAELLRHWVDARMQSVLLTFGAPEIRQASPLLGRFGGQKLATLT